MGKWINRTVTAMLIAPALVLTALLLLTILDVAELMTVHGGLIGFVAVIVLAALLWYARRCIRASSWDGPK